MTQKEVAIKLGISRQAANQCEVRALRKLRDGLKQDPFIREFLKETTKDTRKRRK